MSTPPRWVLARENDWDELGGWIDQLFLTPAHAQGRQGGLSRLEVDMDRAQGVASSIHPRCVAGSFAVIAMSMFRNAKPALQAAILRVLARKLLRPGLAAEQRSSSMLAVASLLTTVPPSAVTFRDLVELGDLLAAIEPSIHFRPMGDGAARWVVRLEWSVPILLSVRQMDDRPDIFIASWVLVALLKYLEGTLTRELPLDLDRTGRELIVWLVNYDEVTTLIPAAREMLEDMGDDMAAVSQPTAFQKGDLVPTFVICRDGISADWALGASRPTEIHDLLVKLISEFIFILYSGHVDLEVLSPKIAAVVGRLVYSDPSGTAQTNGSDE